MLGTYHSSTPSSCRFGAGGRVLQVEMSYLRVVRPKAATTIEIPGKDGQPMGIYVCELNRVVSRSSPMCFAPLTFVGSSVVVVYLAQEDALGCG